MKTFEETSLHLPIRCDIVLAGGTGRRLAPFIRQMRAMTFPSNT